MVEPFVHQFERCVSAERFQRYRTSSRTDLEAVALYLWNASLSESLLQAISQTEVALRNAIHHAMTNHVGNEQWFWAVLQTRDRDVVSAKWTWLASRLKAPPTAGQVLAELTFGFWPYLFERRYNELWTHDDQRLLIDVFPYRPRQGLPPHMIISLAEIHSRLKHFVILRNRVMHHEPIIFGIADRDSSKSVSVQTLHGQMEDLLLWIDPTMLGALRIVDRFADEDARGRERIESTLEALFDQSSSPHESA